MEAIKECIKLPKVSIGMPVYNGARFIREALDSLLTQTFTDFELIVSDNASNDGTSEICEMYAINDSRIRYIRQPENRGAVANFQFVRDEARGEYFIWAAADDLQSEKFLEALVDVLECNPEVVCVMSDVNNVCDRSTAIGYVSAMDDIRLGAVNENWQVCRKRFFRNPTSNVFFCVYGLFRSKIIKKIDLQYKKIHKQAFSSEVPMLAQLALYGRIASISLPLKTYRRHEASAYHSEQKILDFKSKVFGIFLVSWSLLVIIYVSSLTFVEKLFLYASVVNSGFRFLLSLLARSPRKLLKAIFGINKS